jgi:hypothetical protein
MPRHEYSAGINWMGWRSAGHHSAASDPDRIAAVEVCGTDRRIAQPPPPVPASSSPAASLSLAVCTMACFACTFAISCRVPSLCSCVHSIVLHCWPESSTEQLRTHRPFPDDAPAFYKFDDRVEVLHSLQVRADWIASLPVGEPEPPTGASTHNALRLVCRSRAR